LACVAVLVLMAEWYKLFFS